MQGGEGRYETLDALRGVAAILVMAYHAGRQSPVEVAGGYLAVDLFFALSGFVIALAYDQRLRSGFPLLRFVRNRIVRIYPMYALGLLLGCFFYGWSLLPFAFLPDANSTKLVPANVPMWSLLTELAVNVLFALVAPRLGWRALAAVLAASGVTLALMILEDGDVNSGAFWNDADTGLIRTCFSFALGVAIYRGRTEMGLLRRPTWLALVLVLATVMILTYAPANRLWWDMACIFAFIPALLVAGTLWELPAKPAVRWIGRALGDLSYPLYCLHGPIILIWLRYAPPIEVGTSFAVLIVAAWSADRWIDRPLRKWLTSPRGSAARSAHTAA